MSTDTTLQIDCTDLKQSLRLAEQIGSRLRGGELIVLASDLGGGKTTFVRGVAAGSGSEDRVSSPSFTLTNVYDAPSLSIHHYDFYRLDDAGILRAEIQEALNDRHNVVIIEWAAIVEDVLPNDQIAIEITVTGDESRHYAITYANRFEHVFAHLAV